MKYNDSPLRTVALASLAYALSACSSLGQTAFAATVIDYHPGRGVTLDHPYAATGRPGGIVAAGSGFDGVYSPFNPHYESTELTQIGKGGALTLRLEKSVVPVAGQPELGIFTNAGLIDGDFPNGVNVGSFGEDSISIDVSPDGISWIALGTYLCDFPATTFTDSPTPFHPTSDGLTPADFGKPHALQLSDLDGMNHTQILTALGGSAGGTWIDLSASGVASINYVRFRIDDDALPENTTFELAGISINTAAAGDSPIKLDFAEDFATDPIGTRATSTAGHANYANGRLNVDFDLTTPPARTTWPLGQTLTDQTSFRYSAEFTINAINFSENNFGQLSFGLISSLTTGDNRTMAPSNAWDVLTVDYFPSEQFPTFTPTVIGSQQPGQTDAFANLRFPYEGGASLIDDPGEIGQLPTNTQLTASVDYEASSRTLTLRLADQAINADFTNTDDDVSTIQYTIPAGIEFSVDSFAILCWQEPSGGTANISFTNIRVETGGPPSNYYSWADANIAEPLERAADFDADRDGLNNLLDYALIAAPTTEFAGGEMAMSWQRPIAITDVVIRPEISTDLETWTALPISETESEPGVFDGAASTSLTGARKYLRLQAQRP